MRTRLLRAGCWSLAAVLVILFARTIAYAVSPSPVAELLQHRAGGPALPALTLAALATGASLAIAITFLAWLGVRERSLLEQRPAPRLQVMRMLLRAGVLAGATAPLGGLLEAYIHWRAGLGWHGMHCVFGPVHRNLLPIDAALSLVAAAIATALCHLTAWMRRTLERLANVVAHIAAAATDSLVPVSAPSLQPRGGGGQRAPPVFS
jgi:hypothetical protein